MAGLIYYIPRHNGPVNDDVLQGLGLMHLRPCGILPRGVLANGPDGGAGVAFVAHPVGQQPRLPGVHVEAQQWTCCEGGKFWIGWGKGAQPGPADLARPKLLRGHDVQLADGNRWTLPSLSSLPYRMGYDAAGAISKIAKPEHEPFHSACKELARLFTLLIDGNNIQANDVIPHLNAGLSLNYFVGWPEGLALAIWDNQDAPLAAWRALMGADEIEEVLRASEKKKPSDCVAQ